MSTKVNKSMAVIEGVLAVFCLLCFHGCVKNAVSLYQKGLVYERQGKFDKAIIEYKNAIKVNPQFSEAYYQLGLLYRVKGDLNQAIADYSKVIELNPKHAAAYFERGLAYVKEGKTQESIADFKKVAEIEPTMITGDKRAAVYTDILYAHSKAALEAGDIEEALDGLNWVIKIDPARAQAYYDRGLVYAQKSSFEQAIADFLKAVELNPAFVKPDAQGNIYANLLFSAGKEALQQDRNKQAVEYFTWVIKINPDYPQVYQNRGSAFMKKGDFLSASNDYTFVIEADPSDAKAYYGRGCVFLERCKIRNGYDADDYAHADKDPFDKAIADFSTAIELQPDFSDAYVKRARARLERLGGVDLGGEQSIADCTKAIELDPGNAEAYYTRGLTYQFYNAIEKESIADFTQAIEIDPRHARAYCRRGLAYRSNGSSLEEEILDYTKAIEIRPDWVFPYFLRFVTYTAKEEYDKAWEDVHKIEALGSGVAESTLSNLKKASGREK